MGWKHMSQTPTAQTQNTQPEYHIDVDIKIQHLLDQDAYYKTKVIVYVYGEVVLDGKHIKIPHLYSERSMYLTGNIDYELQKIIEDVVDLRQRMLDMINNIIQNKQRLIAELAKYGVVSESYATDN
jgi:hypothetical protein